MVIHPKALSMIEGALEPVIRSGRDINKLRLYVFPDSPLAELSSIHTRFGDLKVKQDDYSRKGIAYILEDPGRKGRGFYWVSRATG
ncbi:hypothetical protein [Paenibacillus senegalimassiliensis]|uniref:hypothetical protein n=1 Tax=Paenibacillus senegalimassiliensis TaxID=1737426 RepID=UPI00073F0D18|nr:hypothetical protein [Paenibacillus senegalimassiliensis]